MARPPSPYEITGAILHEENRQVGERQLGPSVVERELRWGSGRRQNYQSLGLFDGRQLAILRPDKSTRVYAADETWKLTDGGPDAELELDLISYYQTASTSYETGGLARLASTLAEVPEASASDAATAGSSGGAR